MEIVEADGFKIGTEVAATATNVKAAIAAAAARVAYKAVKLKLCNISLVHLKISIAVNDSYCSLNLLGFNPRTTALTFVRKKTKE